MHHVLLQQILRPPWVLELQELVVRQLLDQQSGKQHVMLKLSYP